jgi:DNA-binding transcriptional LysR family regulator
LSRAIQQLEAEVGGLLLRRERNLTHITDLGQLMRPHFEQIISELTKVKHEAKRFLTLESASLRLGIMCTIGPIRFAGLLSDFTNRFPGITIEGIPSELADKLTKGEIDVAIMASPDGFNERFDWLLLYRERFLIAFPKGHRYAEMDAIPMKETKGENYLRRLNCEYWDYLTELSDARGADVNLCFSSEREDWIQYLVAGGLGICYLPEFSTVAQGIETRPVVDPEVSREVCLVTMAGRRHSPAVSSFVKSVRSFPFPASRYDTAG